MTGLSKMDISKLAYEKIDEKYSKAKYLGLECVMDTQTGYINATKFCTAASDGKKRFDNYLRSDRYKNLITEYTEEEGSTRYRGDLVIQVTTGVNEFRGTYFNPDLLLDLASWVSAAAYKRASAIVMNALVRERDDEIRALKGDKCDLVKMLETESAERRAAEKRAEDMLLKMTLQNEKTHIKLEETSEKLDDAKIDNKKLKVTLKRVEKIVEVVAEHVVPPAQLKKLHEQVTLTRVVNDKGLDEYKISCTQQGGAAKARKEILKKYPNAVIIKQIKPNANAKNFKHLLKEKYGSGKTPKVKINNQTITLMAGVTEDDLKVFADEVIETAKAFGSDEDE
jgi:hypothetical protein